MLKPKPNYDYGISMGPRTEAGFLCSPAKMLIGLRTQPFGVLPVNHRFCLLQKSGGSQTRFDRECRGDRRRQGNHLPNAAG